MLTVCPHRGHLLCTYSNTLTVFPVASFLSLCKRSLCFIFFNVDSVGRLCMGATVSDTNDKSLQWMHHPHNPHSPPSSSPVCLLVCQSEHTHHDWHRPTVTLHLISSSNPGLDFSALFLSASLPALVTGHSFHTQFKWAFENIRCRKNLHWFEAGNQIFEAVRFFFFQEGSTHSNLRITWFIPFDFD